MATHYNEKLAKIIADEILEAQDYLEYQKASEELCAIGNALKYANDRSRLECDLRKFAKNNPHYYSDEDIDSIMNHLSAKLDGQIHFRTLTVFYALNSRLLKELQTSNNLWQISKIIYSLGTLYDDDKDLKTIIYSIKDINLRYLTTIVARVYFKGYEEVFDIFSPDFEIEI